MAEHGDSLNGRLRSKGGARADKRELVRGGGGGGVFKLGNDGKINEFKRIIGSKRQGKKHVSPDTT